MHRDAAPRVTRSGCRCASLVPCGDHCVHLVGVRGEGWGAHLVEVRGEGWGVKGWLDAPVAQPAEAGPLKGSQ